MADPFGIAQALADFFHISTDYAGFMLGAALTVGLLITLEWTIGSRAGGRGGEQSLFVAAMFGIILSTLFGWFPAWTVVFAALVVGLILFNPFSTRG
jgi:hypothetical protein